MVGANDGASPEVAVTPAASLLGIRTYRRRWGMLALFCLANLCNAVLWISFSPISSLTASFYGVGVDKVNALSIVFLAAYVPCSFLSNWVVKRWGMRTGLVLACSLNAASGLVRFLSAESNSAPRGAGQTGYWILLAGQTLGAVAQPFFTNLPAKLAAVWFAKEQRDIATVVGALFNIVGIAVGSVLPALFSVSPGPGLPNTSVQMFSLLLTELVLVLVSLVLTAALFQSQPPLPPSLSEKNKDGEQEALRAQLGKMLRNKDFVILSLCFGTGLGFFNALTTLVEQLVTKAGYTTDDASVFSAALLGCGVLSAIAVGLALDRTHWYKGFLKVLFGLAAVAIVAFTLVLRPDNMAALTIVFALMGGLMLPLLPVSFECAVECTFPLNEDVSTGVIMSVGQITGIVFIVALGAMLDKQPVYTTYVFEPAYILIVVATAFFVGPVMFFNGPYLRLNAEAVAADNDHSSPA
jgi:FLVCR family MFS transporter 7